MSEPALDVRAQGDGVTLKVRVKPRSSREALAGLRDGAVVLQVRAPPVEGSANAAVIRLLAALLGRPPSAITLVRGAKGRDKMVHVPGVDVATVRARLTPAESAR
jgi:uncharacterized protein (TIGR00251 family)